MGTTEIAQGLLKYGSDPYRNFETVEYLINEYNDLENLVDDAIEEINKNSQKETAYIGLIWENETQINPDNRDPVLDKLYKDAKYKEENNLQSYKGLINTSLLNMGMIKSIINVILGIDEDELPTVFPSDETEEIYGDENDPEYEAEDHYDEDDEAQETEDNAKITITFSENIPEAVKVIITDYIKECMNVLFEDMLSKIESPTDLNQDTEKVASSIPGTFSGSLETTSPDQTPEDNQQEDTQESDLDFQVITDPSSGTEYVDLDTILDSEDKE